jgi:4-amino-4-deoxy-L-arabinose transferase-like glycosyltransferase
MLNNKKIIYILLGVIFLIAVLFRFINLSAYPAGFHIDEASLGYNGYSLLLTGKDDNGNFLPLYIDMFGDNRPSGYHYLTIVPIILFGLTEFATRFPGALFGSLTVFAMYLLANVIFKNKAISLLSAFLIAVSPWHIVLSRASAETVVALFSIILGFALLINGLRENKNKFIIWGSILTPISYFFYHTPRVFVPLAFLTLTTFFFPFWKKEAKPIRTKMLFVFVFLSTIALFLVLLVKGGTGRYGQVNIFNNFQTSFFIGQERQEDGLSHAPVLLSRMVHNKISNVLRVFIDNYLNYFSGSFLFTKGGLPIWYSVPRMGLMYLVELPFLLFGIYTLFGSKNKMYKLPILWLIIGPVVGGITMDDIPSINRSIVMIPALELIAAVGFVSLVNIFQKKKSLFVGLCMVMFLGNVYYFNFQYFVNAPMHDNWYREDGFSKMMRIVNENYNKYDAVVISKFQGGIYPLVLFYSKYNSAAYQKEGSPKNPDYGGFGKFFFVPQACPSVDKDNRFPKGKIIYIDSGTCPNNSALGNNSTFFINRMDGTRIYRIVYD